MPENILLTSVLPAYYGNTPGAQLTVSGAGFDAATEVVLVGFDGTVYQAQSVVLDSNSQLTVNFDSSQVPVGRYDLKVVSGSGESMLEKAFEVFETQKAKLETHLVLPGVLGRHATATLYVEYKNSGNVSMPAPMLMLVSADPDGSDKPILTLDSSKIIQNLWTSSMPPGIGHSVSFLADGDDPNSPGVLLPGESGRMPVYYTGLLRPWDFSDNRVELQIRIVSGEETAPFDWETYRTAMKPDTVSQEAWDILIANLRSMVGTTWGDYITALSGDAAYLFRHGNRHIRDIDELLKLKQLIRVPRIEYRDACPFEIIDIASDNSHTMDQGRSRD